MNHPSASTLDLPRHQALERARPVLLLTALLFCLPLATGCPDDEKKDGDGWQLESDMKEADISDMSTVDQGPSVEMDARADLVGMDMDRDDVDMTKDMGSDMSEDMALPVDMSEDMPPRDPEPDLVILSEVSFGRVTPGLSRAKIIGLRNGGDEALTISGISLQPSNTVDFEVTYPDPDAPEDLARDSDTPPARVEPGEGFPVRVTFFPLDTMPSQASMRIESNDPDSPIKEVDLLGNFDEPCLEVIGNTFALAGSDAVAGVDFGTVRTGQSSLRTIRLQNCSTSRPHTLYRYMDALNGTDFSVTAAPASDANGELILPPFEEALISVAFDPTSDGLKTASYEITSNATVNPNPKVDLFGEGTSQACPEPVALASVMGSSNPPSQTISTQPLQRVLFDGTQSFDQDGSIVRYEWTIISAPVNSTSRLTPDAFSPQPSFFIDVAGQYVFELSVVDDSGITSCTTAQVTILATSSSTLSIELTWTTPSDPDITDNNGTDLDLHYKQAASVWNTMPDTIFWQSVTSDWGVQGDTSDDPYLDIDDIDGLGPEVISHDNPEAGTYNVGAYYYNDNGFLVSYATVRIYQQGQLIAEERDQYLQREDIFWNVGNLTVDANKMVTYRRVDTVSQGFPPNP